MTPLLPLYTWLEMIGFDPWSGMGIGPIDTGCDTLIRRYAWQNSDAASQLEIEQAIERAEGLLTDYLGYSPAPHYVVEQLAWPARADGQIPWAAAGSDGRRLTVKLREGEVRAVGVETLATVATGSAVTYSDEDGDGTDDTFTISTPTTVTDTSQIAVYFSSGDRFNSGAISSTLSPRWRLQPVAVSISGGTVTIRGPKQLCVKPIKYEGRTNIGPDGLDATLAANFVTTLDIYQRYTGTNGTTTATSQGVITWETAPAHGWWCYCGCNASDPYSGSPYDPAAVAQAVARVGIRDAAHGIVTPAEASYDTTTGIWSALDWSVCSQPDRVTVRYLAGFPLGSDGLMQEPYRTIVARLAAAELARPVCGCEQANKQIYYWQHDLAQTARGDELFSISQNNLDNPLGTRRGHVYAWKAIQNLAQTTGFLA